MCCNNQIHDELKSMEECTCPFCDQQLAEFEKVVESCCNEQDIETIEWYEYLFKLWFSS